MKTIKTLSLFILVTAGFCSCQSSKSIQKQLRAFHANLDYELTSVIRKEKTDQTVYLNYIDNSNMEYFTSVKSSSALVLPFIFFNYWHKQFNIVLGEHTFTQPYWEFLTDALLAECNRSACFELKINDNSAASDVYSLDVKIIRNETLSGIKESNRIFIIPTVHAVFDFIYQDYQALSTSSDLEIGVVFKKGTDLLWEKQYSIHENCKSNTLENPAFVNEICISQMTECLALASKQIVTEISRDLNLILSAQ